MTHYKSCRTAKDLAVLCGYNDTMFNLLFKKCFSGETPYRWLQKRTSHEIKLKLIENILPVKQIMLEYHLKRFLILPLSVKEILEILPMKYAGKELSLKECLSLRRFSVSVAFS